MAHTIYYMNGFDQKENLMGGSITVEETIVSLSKVSCKAAVSNSQYTIMNWNLVGSADNYYWISFHLYVETLPGAGQDYHLQKQFAGIWRGGCWLNEDGKLSCYRESGGTTTSTGALQTGKWYVISIRRGAGAYPKIIARDRDTGALVAEAEVAANDDSVHTMYLGPTITNSYGTCYWDNVVVEWSSSGWTNLDDPVNLLTTKYAVGFMYPTGDGYYDAWTNDYTYVDDMPNDGATTMRTLGGALGAFTQTYSQMKTFASAAGTIHAVRQYVWISAIDGSVTMAMRLRVAGTDYDTDSNSYAPSAWSHVWRVRTTNPYTSSAWLQSDLDSIQFGVVRPAATSTGYTGRCTALGFEVLYTTMAVARLPKITYAMDVADAGQRVWEVEHGSAVALEELNEDTWMHLGSIGLPTPEIASSFMDRDDLTFNEEAVYRQAVGTAPTLDLSPSTFDFIENLVARLSEPTGTI